MPCNTPGLLTTYVLYVLAVLNWSSVLAYTGLEQTKANNSTLFGEGSEEPAEETRRQSTKDRVARYIKIVETAEEDGPARTLINYLWPFDSEDIRDLPWPKLCLAILRSPVVFAMRLTVPVVDRNLPREGWVRPAMAVNMLFFPPLLASFVLFQDGIPDEAYEFLNLAIIYGVAFGAGLVLSIIIWITSAESEMQDTPPPYHRYLGLVGFFMSLVWIFATAREIVNAVLAFGVVFEVGSLILGVTILAIGIGMQDLVTCVGIARAGLPAMAASACVGSSLMNILVGIGLSGLLGASMVSDPYPLYVSVQLLTCIFFMALSIIIALGYMSGSGFRTSTLFGATLIGLYVAFIIVSLVVDMLGTDTLASVGLASSKRA